MTREEAKNLLIDISYDFGSIAVEYLTEKDGEKMREAIEALVQEPCEDVISRQAVLDALDKSKYSNMFCEEHNIDWSINLGMAHIVVNELKPVTPQPKTGHWVEENINEWSRKIFCSKCGCAPPFEYISSGDVYSASGYGVSNKTKYCPNCGAKMVEPQESDGEE